MAIPVLKLNLAPPPTLWRQRHVFIGWSVLIAGSLILAGVLAATAMAYIQAEEAGRRALDLTEQAQAAARKERDVQARLQAIDVEKELPRWRLAERILQERSFPWSRLTAELERSLVQDVRLKSIQRTRDSTQKVELKIKGEAKTRAAEEAFVDSLQKNAFFSQVILERESENQTGGLEFDYTLPATPLPPGYVSLPKYGPALGNTQPATVAIKETPRAKAPVVYRPPAAMVQTPPPAPAPLPRTSRTPQPRIFMPSPRIAPSPVRAVPPPMAQPEVTPPIEEPTVHPEVPEVQPAEAQPDSSDAPPANPRIRGRRHGPRRPAADNSDQPPTEPSGEESQ